jgi:hypothetical protein
MIKHMGKVTKPKDPKTSPLMEVKALAKIPKYDLSTMLSQASEGLSPYLSHELVFNSCVRGGSWL